MHHFAWHQWSKLQTKLTTLGYSRKSGTGWLRIYFSENPTSRNFSDLSLYPKEFQKKTSFYAWKFSLKWQFLLVKNKLKILNWRTTDPKSIKFTLHVCHLNTFLLLKTVGVNWRAAESISRKTIKNAKNVSNSWLPLLKISL